MNKILSLQKIGGTCALFSGLSHVLIQTVVHSFLLTHAIFFFLFGILQVWWGYRFFKDSEKSDLFLYWWVAINWWFLGLWITTRILPAPFIGSPEYISIIGIIVAILQLIALVAIVNSFKRSKDAHFFITKIIISLGIILVSTFGTYGLGMLWGHIFPDWKAWGHHHSHWGHNH